MSGDPDYGTESMRRWRRKTDPVLIGVAVGSLPLLLMEFERDKLTYADRVVLDVVNLIVLVAFAVDYGVELVLARNRAAYVRGEWLNGLVVAMSALAIVPRLAFFGGARVVRGAPALRGLLAVGRAIALGGSSARDGRQLLKRRAVTFAVCVAGLTWLTAAAAFSLAEDVGEGGRVESFVDALWWSAATITTVGYGDVTPITVAGRVAGLVAMVVGISTFAVLTARAASFLITDDDDSATAGERAPAEAVSFDMATANHLTAGYGYLRMRAEDAGELDEQDWAMAFDPGRSAERDRFVLARSGASGQHAPLD